MLSKNIRLIKKNKSFSEKTFQKFLNSFIKKGFKFKFYKVFSLFLVTNLKRNLSLYDYSFVYIFFNLFLKYKPLVRLRTRRKGSQLIQIPYLFGYKSGISRYVTGWFKEDLNFYKKEHFFYKKFSKAFLTFMDLSKSIGYKKFLEYHALAMRNSIYFYMLKRKKKLRNFRRF